MRLFLASAAAFAAVSMPGIAWAQGPQRIRVSVEKRDGTNWTQPTRFKASNPDADDRFGVSVALWGDTGAIGAIWEDSNFNYWNAQTKILNSSLVPFIKGVETTEDAISVTVTFDPDGIHSTQTTHSKLKPQP